MAGKQQHPASLANLDKGKATQFISGEVAATNGRKGGLKKAQKTRAFREARDLMRYLLSMDELPGTVNYQLLDALGAEDKTQKASMLCSLLYRAKATGDPKAVELALIISGDNITPIEEDEQAQKDLMERVINTEIIVVDGKKGGKKSGKQQK